MRIYPFLFLFPLSSLLLGQGIQEEEYTTPEPYREYHSNLGRQSIVKANRQKEFNFVGQEPQEIAPGSIPLGSLREWSKKERGEVLPSERPTGLVPPAEPSPRKNEIPRERFHPVGRLRVGLVNCLPRFCRARFHLVRFNPEDLRFWKPPIPNLKSRPGRNRVQRMVNFLWSWD